MTFGGTSLDFGLCRSYCRKTLFPALQFLGNVHAIGDVSAISSFGFLEQFGNFGLDLSFQLTGMIIA